MDTPTSCNCGGAYSWQQDRLVCNVCGVPYTPAPTAPHPGETATDAELRAAQERWDEYQRERAAAVEHRDQLSRLLADLAVQANDARLRLHQAEARLHALDSGRGPLDKAVQDAKKAASTAEALAERERTRAAQVKQQEAARQAKAVEQQLKAQQERAAQVKQPSKPAIATVPKIEPLTVHKGPPAKIEPLPLAAGEAKVVPLAEATETKPADNPVPPPEPNTPPAVHQVPADEASKENRPDPEPDDEADDFGVGGKDGKAPARPAATQKPEPPKPHQHGHGKGHGKHK